MTTEEPHSQEANPDVKALVEAADRLYEAVHDHFYDRVGEISPALLEAFHAYEEPRAALGDD